MKTIYYDQYGPPDVLQMKDMETPVPAEDEVLVNVLAAAANPLDWHNIRGEPYMMRFEFGLTEPKHKIPGADIAGRVEAAGANVTRFQPGDEVFGDISHGGFAEFACAPENRLVHKPENLSFEEAAAVPVAAVTALQGMRDSGNIASGQRVLVNGSSGGVGTFSVQIAKSYGTEVTGVCSTNNLELVRSIGADKVIDYTEEDFTRTGRQYDLVIDNVGNRSVGDLREVVSAGGRCIIIGFTSLSLLFQHMLLGGFHSRLSTKSIGLMGAAQPNHHDLSTIKELIEAGKVRPVIDRTYALNELPEAIRYLEKGHASGKVVINMKN